MRMEVLVLTTLQWRVSAATSATFLEHQLRALGLRTRVRRLLRVHARAVIERTQPHAAFLAYPPSSLACAALHHALCAARLRGRPLAGCAERLGLAPGASACLAALEALGPAWSGQAARAPAAAAPLAALATPTAHAGHHRKPSLGERESPMSTLDGAAFEEEAEAGAGAAAPPPPPPPLAPAAEQGLLKRGIELRPPAEWKRLRGAGAGQEVRHAGVTDPWRRRNAWSLLTPSPAPASQTA